MTDVSADNPYYDPSKPHHTPEGFRNNYIDKVEKPVGHVLRWQWEAYRDGLPKPAQTPTPTVAPDLAQLRGYTPHAQPTVTWIGHATLLVQAGGLNVLTDPVFSERASPLQIMGPKRAQPPGVAMDDLPPIDIVLISHNHYDHLDRSSVLLLAERGGGKTLFLVPLGLKPWMEKQGIANVVELDWWQHHDVGGVEFHLTPVQHWSARGVGDRSETDPRLDFACADAEPDAGERFRFHRLDIGPHDFASSVATAARIETTLGERPETDRHAEADRRDKEASSSEEHLETGSSIDGETHQGDYSC